VRDALINQSIELPGGELRVLQPLESAELPDAGAVEWAPIAPYWSVLWRSGVALARELDGDARAEHRPVGQRLGDEQLEADPGADEPRGHPIVAFVGGRGPAVHTGHRTAALIDPR